MDEEFDIMPHRAVASLKKEIEDLKSSPQVREKQDKMLGSIDKLNDTMSSMMEMFKQAGEELKLEEREEAALSEQIIPLMKKLDAIIDQNEKIAKGMVAIADMVNEVLPKLEARLEEKTQPAPASQPTYRRPEPRTVQPPSFDEPFSFDEPSFDMPGSMPPSGNMPPPPSPGMQPPSFGMPPPPPQSGKKGLLGGLFKK